MAEGALTGARGRGMQMVRGRTVQTHLVHVFAKLDIASHAQLAAQVTRHRD